MFYLIEYDRLKNELTQIKEFTDQKQAWEERFKLETKHYNQGCIMTMESALFEADSLEDLKKTHSRYFYDFRPVVRGFIKNKGRLNRSIKQLRKKSKEILDKMAQTP